MGRDEPAQLPDARPIGVIENRDSAHFQNLVDVKEIRQGVIERMPAVDKSEVDFSALSPAEAGPGGKASPGIQWRSHAPPSEGSEDQCPSSPDPDPDDAGQSRYEAHRRIFSFALFREG
jgi:hypothetical protein